MKVREVLGATPAWIGGEMSVADAARFMKESNCSFLPILDNRKAIGVVTDRDIAMAVSLADVPLADINIKLVMSAHLHSVNIDASLEEVAHTMADNHVRRLVVLESQNFVGVISVFDLVGLAPQQLVYDVLNEMRAHNHPRPCYMAPAAAVPGQYLG